MGSSITTGSYLFPRFNRSGAQVFEHVHISFPASTDLELNYYNRFVSPSRFHRSGAQILQQVRISFPASTDLELKYNNRFVSLPRFKRSGTQILQQVRISFPASIDLELKYNNRFVSLSPVKQIWSSGITTGSYLFPPLQQIWSSSITTGSYLFPRFNRSGAELLQQVGTSFPASKDLELKYYNRFVSLSQLQQIWSSSITTGSYLFPRFNRSGAQVLQKVRTSFSASTDLGLKYYNRFVSLSPLQQIWSSSIRTCSYLFPRFNRS